MAIKKSELYSSLWASCDELRGGMDPSRYKEKLGKCKEMVDKLTNLISIFQNPAFVWM